MAHYPGYTVLRTEDCPEQHGTLTLLTHDVSGAAVLLVENEDVNKFAETHFILSPCACVEYISVVIISVFISFFGSACMTVFFIIFHVVLIRNRI